MFKNKVLGVLTFVFSASLIYVTRYTLQTFKDLMPDTFMKVLFWIGYITIIMFALLVKPITLFVSNNPSESPAGLFYATVSFIVGMMLSKIIYYLYDGLLNVLSFSTELTSILWFMYIIVIIMSMVVVPIVLLIANPETTMNVVKNIAGGSAEDG